MMCGYADVFVAGLAGLLNVTAAAEAWVQA